MVAVDAEEFEDSNISAEASLDELAELAKTAGAEVVGRMVQKLPYASAATYIGSGKAMELCTYIDAVEATGIITDDELTNAQMANLQKLLDCKVMDRTMLILDIFAKHAHSAEGMLQVELAQLNYRLGKLTGQGVSLSRLGGGIGTRGPGEKKLEVDRRVIRNRIAALRREIKELQAHREITRAKRSDASCTGFAIVGYTNVGKSTLLNALTGADILAENKLFATLDTTTRRYAYKYGNTSREVLLTDTVGFIRKLPHHLIEAFNSTLMEAGYSDHIIHVVDASDPSSYEKMQTVYDTLAQLGIKGKKILTIFNKTDQCDTETLSGLKDIKACKTLKLSAKTGEGLEQIPQAIEEILMDDGIEIEGLIPYSKTALLNEIHQNGTVSFEEYTPDGISIRARVNRRIASVIERSTAD